MSKTRRYANAFEAVGFSPYSMEPAALASLIDSDTVAYAAIVKRTGAVAD